MAGSHTITVGRQVVDAEVRGSERDGLVVQQYLAGSVERVVADALEQALEELAPTEDHLVVDTLEIELVDVPLDGLDEALAEAVRHDAAAFFRRHTPRRPDGNAVARTAEAPVTRRSGAATAGEAFVVFLRTGRVPWSFTGAGGAELEAAVRRAAEGPDGDPGPGSPMWQRVREALLTREARQRVVKQFSPAFVHWLVRRLAPDVAHAMTAALAPARVAVPTRSAFDRQVRLAAVVAAAKGRPTTSRALVTRALAGIPAAAREDRRLAEHLDRRWPGVESDPTGPGAPADESPVATVSVSDRGITPGDDLAALAAGGDGSPSYLVDHAGLVLLHPFLPRFLEGLGMAADGLLVDVDRAVALLHHLATGGTVVRQETTLAKVLCGCPLGEPVEREPGLTPDETAEATALLTAVIGHWEALRSTSPDAVRAEFLTRPGLLAVDDTGDWLLRVEQRSVDILLEQLPWELSMVRTPWMQRMLRVEWRV